MNTKLIILALATVAMVSAGGYGQHKGYGIGGYGKGYGSGGYGEDYGMDYYSFVKIIFK